MPEIKILSLNTALAPRSFTRHRRLPQICYVLREQIPDVVALQEVFFHKDASYLQKAFAEKGYHYTFHYKNLLLLSKFPLQHCQWVQFTSQGPLCSWAVLDKLYGKGYQMAEIKIQNKTILIVNTHLLSANGASQGRYETTRKAQCTQILSQVSHADKVILTGDFNFDIHTPPYQLITKHTFIDPMEKIAGETFIGTPYRLDHIFIKGIATKAIQVKIIWKRSWPSDHYAIMLNISEIHQKPL